MYLLDTDMVNLYVHRRGQQQRLAEKLATIPSADIWISVITIEEAVAGAFKLINGDKKHANHSGRMLAGYRLLHSLIPDYSTFQLLAFDDSSYAIYKGMSAETRRVGANDCKIAAIALSHDFTVITRNTRHFASISGLRCEDWTMEKNAKP